MVGQLTDAEMEDLFGQQPSLTESRDSGTPQGKRPRSQITRSVEKAKDKGKGKGGSHGSSKSEEMEIIQQLSRIVLRHEDQLLRIQMDTLLIFQLRSNVDGAFAVLPTLYETANEWKRRHQQDPKNVDKSLRQTVLLRLIQELRSRLQLAQSNPQLLQEKGWLNERKAWVYQQWNPDKQQLEPQGKDDVPMDQLLRQVDEAAKLLKTPDILLKFQSTRPLTSQMTGPVITYLCELALRGEEANRLYTLFRMWAGLSGLLVVGLQVKGPRLQRSAMAQQLQKTVFRPYLHSNLPTLTITAI